MINNVTDNLLLTNRYIVALSGILLIALGLLFLVRNILTPGQEFRWWAMFILLPAMLLFGCAWLVARLALDYRITLTLFGLGLVVLTVAAIFLLNLTWEHWWPLMIIVPALTLFLIGLPNSALFRNPEVAAWVGVLAWVGGATILLGLIFLAGNFRVFDLRALSARFGWWGLIIFLCAAGTLFNALWLWGVTGAWSISVWGLMLVAILLFISATFELFHFDWRLRLGWMLIGSGLWIMISIFISRWTAVKP